MKKIKGGKHKKISKGNMPKANEAMRKVKAALDKGGKDSSVVGGKIKVKAQPIFLKSGGKGKVC